MKKAYFLSAFIWCLLAFAACGKTDEEPHYYEILVDSGQLEEVEKDQFLLGQQYYQGEPVSILAEPSSDEGAGIWTKKDVALSWDQQGFWRMDLKKGTKELLLPFTGTFYTINRVGESPADFWVDGSEAGILWSTGKAERLERVDILNSRMESLQAPFFAYDNFHE